jgi:signal-transduction protein with cAMP-binding, CBS, and nucleotidyltransferase domain
MKHELKRFLDKFEIFTPEEVTELSELLKVVKIEKGAVLVKEGQICNSCFFVLMGCMRKYVNIEGDEKNLALYTEEQSINFFTSYSKKTPSNSYLAAVEESILL